MKTDTAGWTSLSLLFFLMTFGCAHLPNSNNEIARFYESNGVEVAGSDLRQGRIVTRDEAQLVYERGPERLVKVFRLQFKSMMESLSHLMSRRVAVSALFRDLIEPYYGLIERKKCVDLAQFSTDFIELGPDEKYFSVKFPVDPYLNPLDCEREDPKLHAQYVFLACESRLDVFEVRLYQPISIPFDDKILFRCK